MPDFTNPLVQVFLLFYVGGAMVGGFIGTLLALAVRALYRKMVK